MRKFILALGVAWLPISTVTLAAKEARADIAYAWGDNVHGQLGDGTQIDRSTPAPVTGLASGVTAVAAGEQHSLALQNGGVYAWGYDGAYSSTPFAVSDLSSGVTAIANGGVSMALKNGGVYAWGFDVGTGAHPSPVAVIGLTSGVTSIAAGDLHSLAVQNGSVYAWGGNNYGQLGNGTTTNSSTPVAVTGLSSGVTAIAAGGKGDGHSLALQNGGVYAWGDDITTNGIDLTPVAVTGLASGVTSIAAGAYHNLAVKNGGVYAWGSNFYGQLGDGTTNDHTTPEQIDPTHLHTIIEVAAGGFSSYALSSDGSLWDWGYNGFGQLGQGTQDNNYLTPQHLLPPSGYMFTSIAGGDDHAVATLTAVPEPETIVLLMFAVAGWYLRRARVA